MSGANFNKIILASSLSVLGLNNAFILATK